MDRPRVRKLGVHSKLILSACGYYGNKVIDGLVVVSFVVILVLLSELECLLSKSEATVGCVPID